jgi:hypothetical protein
LADLRTNAITAEIPLTGVRISTKLGAAGTMSGTWNITQNWSGGDPYGLTRPARTAIYALRDGRPLFGGVVWTSDCDNGNSVSLGASDFWSYFDHRRVVPLLSSASPPVTEVANLDVAFVQVDQNEIARQLLAIAQSHNGGDIGIIPDTANSDVLRDRTWHGYELADVGQALKQLSEVEGGPDIQFTVGANLDDNGRPIRLMRIGTPDLGQVGSPFVFESGRAARASAPRARPQGQSRLFDVSHAWKPPGQGHAQAADFHAEGNEGRASKSLRGGGPNISLRRRLRLLPFFIAGSLLVPVPAAAHTCVRHADGSVGQTSDPMSPPCVPFFTGDNGGDTWIGVDAEEIRILAYFDAGTYEGERTPAGGTLLDLDTAPTEPCPKQNDEADPCAHILVRATRAYVAYFYDHFQTYNRRPHIYAYFSDARSIPERRADAALLYEQVHPFAVFDHATLHGENDAFIQSLTARRTMVFASPRMSWHDAAFFNLNAPHVWSFWPDLERRADLYAGYVCTKVKPYPVRHMGAVRGQDPHVGEPRSFGIYYPESPPEYPRFASLVKARLAACGIEWGLNEAAFPRAGYVADADDPGASQAAAVERFRNGDVTTVLWLGGTETKFTALADAASYFPEIVVAGDEALESADTGRHQNQVVWKNAWAVHIPLRDYGTWSFAEQAYLEGDPGASDGDVRFGMRFYRDHFLFFYAVQLSGPRLTPERIDQGLHAIPAYASSQPPRAAFYFDAGDYSGVKDATEVWWDPTGVHPRDGGRGCMRMVAQGSRTRAQDWSGPSTVFVNDDDPCTGFKADVRVNTGSPKPPIYCTLPVSIPILCD